MRKLHLMRGVTREYRIRKEYIRGSTKVVEISKEDKEGRLKWYSHLPRKRSRDCVEKHLREKGTDEEAHNGII